jgi:hypothetical protein
LHGTKINNGLCTDQKKLHGLLDDGGTKTTHLTTWMHTGCIQGPVLGTREDMRTSRKTTTTKTLLTAFRRLRLTQLHKAVCAPAAPTIQLGATGHEEPALARQPFPLASSDLIHCCNQQSDRRLPPAMQSVGLSLAVPPIKETARPPQGRR